MKVPVTVNSNSKYGKQKTAQYFSCNFLHICLLHYLHYFDFLSSRRITLSHTLFYPFFFYVFSWFFDQATDEENKKAAKKKKGMLSRIAGYLSFRKKGTVEVRIEK